MTLYCKAGPDGSSIGDCPFCHAVRITLEEKQLAYHLIPTTADTKPAWLVDYYEGKMPALQHGRECYTESVVILEYLDFFFPQPAMQCSAPATAAAAAAAAVDGLFPAVAAYLKHTPDGDEDDLVLQQALQDKLQVLNQHLAANAVAADDDDTTNNKPLFLCGNDQFTLEDCQLAPKLYHLQIGLQAFKKNNNNNTAIIDLSTQYPAIGSYMDCVFARPSFQKTLYPAETVVWGWNNARSKK